MILSLIATVFLSSPSHAATKCQWTAQGTDANFASEDIYKTKPQIEKASCSSDGKPNCVGYAYCKDSDGKVPPQVIPMACATIKVSGKFRCPDAETCIKDQEVAMSPMKNPPAVPSAPPATPAGAPAAAPGTGAVREGVPQ